jgi:tRNA threonylcarbamoyl adenosine modification protein YjeE
MRRWLSTSVEATRQVGRELAAELAPDRALLLSGDLGAGKTQFVKGMARGLGVEEPVTSPTFNIMLVHECRLPLFHVDLYRLDEPQAADWSDRICTGLQLANFWQDVAIDWTKGRVYLPQDQLARYGLAESAIAEGGRHRSWPALMRAQTERARLMLESGAPLTGRLPGRIGWELRLVIQGGLRILERIDMADGDVFSRRPRLRAPDWLLMTARSLAM